MLLQRNIYYILRPKFFHSTVYVSYREDYIRLGISEKATKEEIKAAYYEKAKLLHPDATEHCKIVEEEFFELNEAYKRLIYESKYESGSYDKRGRFYKYFLKRYQLLFLDPRNDPRTHEYWDIRRRRQSPDQINFDDAFNNRARKKEKLLMRKGLIALALGVFFGTIFPAIFVGSDTESYYRTGCECDSCILGNDYY